MAPRKRDAAPAAETPATPKTPDAAAQAVNATLPASEQPDAASIARWFERQWLRWRGVRLLDEVRRSRRFRLRAPTHTGPQGEGNELASVTTRTGILRTFEREFLGIVASQKPRVEAVKQGPGPVHERRASDVELWDNAWFEHADGMHVRSLVYSDALVYGRGLSAVLHAPQLWFDLRRQGPEESDGDYLAYAQEYKQGAPCPIVWRHYPAPQAMFEEDLFSRTRGPARVCAWEVLSLSDLAERYPQSKLATQWQERLNQDVGRQGRGGRGSKVDDERQLYVCFANRKYVVYAAAPAASLGDQQTHLPASVITTALDTMEVLATIEHGLGVNPFVVQAANVTSDPDLENRFEGVFDNTLDLIDRADDALTQFATLVRRYARAMPMVEWELVGGQLPPGLDPATLTSAAFEWNPDVVRNLLPGQKFLFAAPDLAGLDKALSYYTLVERLIQRDTLNPSSWSAAGNQSQSGWQEVVQGQNATRKLKLLVDRDQDAMGRVFELAHLWVRKLGDTESQSGVVVPTAVSEEGSEGYAADSPTAGYLTLTPKQAQAARIAVRVDARLDAVDAASAQIALQLLAAVAQGLADIDPAWIMAKWLDLENPEQHMTAAYLWRYLHAPAMVEFITKQAMEQAQLQQQNAVADILREVQSLPPQDQAKIPPLLLARLQQEGVLPGGQPGGAPGGMPGPPPMGPMGRPGMPPPGGLPPGAPPGAPSPLQGLFGATAPPSPPTIGAAVPGGPRAPGLGMPAAGPGGPVGQTGAAVLRRGGPPRGAPRPGQGAMRTGRPRTPREGGL